MIHRLARITAVGAVLTAVLVGCTAQPDPTATPTAVFSSDEEAFAAAEATYRAYVDALNAVDLSDPETFEDVYAWTTGDANAGIRKSLSTMHAEDLTVTGTTVLILVQASSPQPVRSSESVALDACVDVSAVEVSRQDGASAVDPARSDVQSVRVTLTRNPGAPFNYLVAELASRDGEPQCGE
ncbi:hypothetical protein [Microbacterium marmarense]|uniref:Lipoprotein n=1 Tax=Microbacterium marmarense TaxID=3122051 RepID=A0ABU8LST6_9MICO